MRKLGLMCLVLVCGQASAMPCGGYVGVFAGKALAGPNDHVFDCSGWEGDRGYTFAASGGYGWRCGLRAELELGYHGPARTSCEWEVFENESLGFVKCSARKHIYSLMANLIYAVPLRCGVRPYVGVGTGYGWGHVTVDREVIPTEIPDEDEEPNAEPRPVPGCWTGDRFSLDGSLPFQVLAGVEVDMSQCVTLRVEYRYLNDYGTHTVGFGLRRFL
jgi:opacity protein-like surface antigen